MQIIKTQICLQLSRFQSWSRGYKTCSMLSSAEHEIFSTNKYENAHNSWHVYIY